MEYHNSSQLPGFNANGAGGSAVDIHEPFTVAEHMEQLSKIEIDIVSLPIYASEALKIIVQPPDASGDNTMGDSMSADKYTAVQSQFIETLDRIDKLLKRQIFALEEAGIITLRGSSDRAAATADGSMSNDSANQSFNQSFNSAGTSSQQDGAIGSRTKGPVASLDPDGMGRYGKLDTGVLNIASNTVERDMESELWKRAKEHLTKVAANQGDRMQE
ncbi:mediator complex, subunit Med11 [Rhypophila decipiens]|uniref:Mediator of RNA polymerase II transcription subunit 11 n=1 Tax=Rhypophila decipiens TaxID=261697 RepID=A0AAN6Y2I4_9PEZI|nr:mediator complex, subunit Med11 [Rhypophila decipiens]